jgi:hypothetical protein
LPPAFGETVTTFGQFLLTVIQEPPMGRAIAGVIVGYIVMFAVMFAVFAGAYLGLGADKAFNPGTYEVSTLWIAIMVAVNLVAALAGGLVCAAIAGRCKPGLVLAGIVLVLGLAMSYPVLAGTQPDPGPRTASVPNMEAMMKAKTPKWLVVLCPVVGAVGALVGASLKKEAPKPA